MKKASFLLAAALLGLMPTLGARRVVCKAGTLAAAVGADSLKVRSLTVYGEVGGADLQFLRRMAGSDYRQQPTAGRLVRLNLRHARFVPDSVPYILKNSPQYITSEHAVPKFMLRHTHLQRLVLPRGIDVIGEGAFEYSDLRSIALPDGASIESYAFNAMPQLKNIRFARYTAAIYGVNFMDCPRLTRLRVGDVGYVSGYAINKATGLRTLQFGNIGHIDGNYTVNGCLQLRAIDFKGDVVSTGGAQMFTDCPELERVTFHGAVLSSYIGRAEGCPKLRGYDTRDWVLSTIPDSWLPQMHLARTPQATVDANPRKFVDVMRRFIKIDERPKRNARDLAEARPAYARALLKTGHPREAAREVESMIDAGWYNGWAKLQADSVLSALLQTAPNDTALAAALDRLEKEQDYIYVLRHAPAYSSEAGTLPSFKYVTQGDSLLTRIRQYFNLDSIAGTGSETDRIKRLMYWMHDLIPHDGSIGAPEDVPHNVVDMYQAVKGKQGLNCRMLAKLLTQCYLAMGWPARFVTCEPRLRGQDNDCHVICIVWSRELGKWVWMDPSFAAYVSDENGLLLHPGEVRQRLIAGRPLVLNPDANWNHKTPQTKQGYLETYMAKNLYFLSCALVNSAETENGGSDHHFVELDPVGISTPWYITTHSEAAFYQPPR